jgi:nucleoside-triphosphatase THEP1
MKKINILTGPIQSGKTTRLIAWVKYHRHSSGILTPVINKVRYIYSIHANNYQRLQVDDDQIPEKGVVKIGRYSFLESTFQWAREELISATTVQAKYLLIDEIGPLELSGRGLEPAVSTILQHYIKSPNYHLILVVRENLLEQVISHYNLEDHYITDYSFLSTL